jgi:hypothetical protein
VISNQPPVDFYGQRPASQMEPMEIELDQTELFNFNKVLYKLNSSVWYHKVEALEELLRNLIDLPLEDL